MPRLINVSKNLQLAEHVEIAKTFLSRMQGLLGRSSMPEGTTLWIPQCPSIHTFFMKFAIDVIFVDHNLKVVKIYQNIAPWRMTWPHPRYDSVFEFHAGAIAKLNQKGLSTSKRKTLIEPGDQLHVDA